MGILLAEFFKSLALQNRIKFHRINVVCKASFDVCDVRYDVCKRIKQKNIFADATYVLQHFDIAQCECARAGVNEKNSQSPFLISSLIQ